MLECMDTTTQEPKEQTFGLIVTKLLEEPPSSLLEDDMIPVKPGSSIQELFGYENPFYPGVIHDRSHF